jgi:hypothetical protein
MRQPKAVRLTISLTEPQILMLETLAVKWGVSLSEAARRVFDEYPTRKRAA